MKTKAGITWLWLAFGLLQMAAGQTGMPDKCSPEVRLLLSPAQKDSVGSEQGFFLLTLSGPDCTHELRKNPEVQVVSAHALNRILVIRTSREVLLSELLPLECVQTVELGKKHGSGEILVPGHNLQLNGIAFAHHRFPELTGSGSGISIKEFRFDTTDIDLKGRVLSNQEAEAEATGHAAITATLAAGAGNAASSGKGVAPGAGVVSSAFTFLLPNPDVHYQQFQIQVQNHSYGTEPEPFYGSGALAYDAHSDQFPELIHVFSAGNSGTQTVTSGPYAGIQGAGTLTGNFKMAKNILTVGATDSFGVVTPFSSRGPAYDGRIKPELVAFGQDGTSGAAALVSGGARIVQQAFFNAHGFQPSSATVRAILLGSADDPGTPGPDFESGFGSFNLKKAIELARSGSVWEEMLFPEDSFSGSFALPPKTHLAKITLTWNDPPAAPFSEKACIHDLDLVVIDPNGNRHFPLVPNSFPHPDSLGQAPARRRDTLNSAEQIQVLNPTQGNWTIRVVPPMNLQQPQSFSLAVHTTPVAHFHWIHPTAGQPLEAGKATGIYWETAIYPGDSAALEWRFLPDTNWTPVSVYGSPSLLGVKVSVPDTFSPALLQIRMGDTAFVSDTFLITPVPRLTVGFACEDSLELTWNLVAAAAQYQVWALGEKYLEPVGLFPDTQVVLNRVSFPQARFAVESRHSAGNWRGLRSTSVNTADFGCYFQALLAIQNEQGGVDLKGTLGSITGVEAMVWEKWLSGGWQTLATLLPNTLQPEFTDSQPSQGLNRYRLTLQFTSGQILNSEPGEVFFIPADQPWIVYPNPISSGNSLRITGVFGGETAYFSLFDLSGKLIFREELRENDNEWELPAQVAGICLWEIKEGSVRTTTGKLVITP
jgi:hypothetical protein